MCEKVVILYSGGADSRLMLELAKEMKMEIHCLLIDYGQLHIDELKFAKMQLEKVSKTYKNLTWSDIKIDLNIDSGLTGNGRKNKSIVVHEMHTPGRNSIFLSCAFSKAESFNYDTIWIGCDWSDRLNLFPDCYQEYLIKMNEAFKFAGPKPIKIEAPIIGFTKTMVLKLLENYSIEKEEIFSGYGDL